MIHDELQKIVDEQAENEALWSIPLNGLQPIGEALLQTELRKLHAAIENRTTDKPQCPSCLDDKKISLIWECERCGNRWSAE